MTDDANTPLSDSRPADEETRARRIGPGLLFVCFLVAGVFAAWQGHRIWFAPAAEPDERDLTDLSIPATVPDDERFLHEPLSVANLTRLADEPGGIAPPPQARRLRAFERSDGRLTEQFATYELPAESASAAVEHYRAVLSEAGLDPFGEAESDHGRVLVFGRDETQVVVGLRERAEKEKIDLTLSIMMPAKRAGESGEEP